MLLLKMVSFALAYICTIGVSTASQQSPLGAAPRREEFVPEWDGSYTIPGAAHTFSTLLRSDSSHKSLTMLSATFHPKGSNFGNPRNPHRPFWVDFSPKPHQIHLLDRDHLLTGRKVDSDGFDCALELLGTVPKKWPEAGLAQLFSGSETAKYANKTKSLAQCYFMTQWVRREGLVAGATWRSVLFWCEVRLPQEAGEAAACAAFRLRDQPLVLRSMHEFFMPSSAPPLQSLRPQDYLRPFPVLSWQESTSFTVRALRYFQALRLMNGSEGSSGPQIAVEAVPGLGAALACRGYPVRQGRLVAVSVVPYGGSSALVRMQLLSWVWHHLRLGMRVVVYERGGVNGPFLRRTLRQWRGKARRGRAQGADPDQRFPAFEYRPFTVRDMLGFKDEQQVSLLCTRFFDVEADAFFSLHRQWAAIRPFCYYCH
jgi:hypothetical protein